MNFGCGKTKFTEGILSYFGLEEEISSPTFTIVNEYYPKNKIWKTEQSSFPIYHFDVYRLEDIDEFYAIGGEDYFEKGISIIEWGEKIEQILPKGYIKITFTKLEENENYRELTIEF